MTATNSDRFVNWGSTTLAGGAGGAGTSLNPADTSMTVAASSELPATTPFTLVLTSGVNHEIVRCTTIAGGVYTITRAQEGTTALTFVVGSTVASEFTAASVANLWTGLLARSASVADYGAVGDGATDNTTAIQNALNDLNTAGGGLLTFGAGTYLTQTLTWYSNIYARGAGANATVLQLKSGTNADLINGGATNLSLINVTNTTIGNGNTGGLAEWGLADLTLDGNKAGQTSGTSYCLNVYGLNYLLRDCHIRNGYSGGALLDWNGGSTPAGQDGMEGRIQGVRFRANNGVNLTLGGPHDSQVMDCLFEASGSHNLYVGPHATGIQFTTCHAWGSATGVSAVTALIEASQVSFLNCELEGSDVAQLVINGYRCTYIGGSIFGSTSFPATGVKFGQAAGLTPYAGSAWQSAGVTTAVTCYACLIDTTFLNLTGANGIWWFANDAGGNVVRGAHHLSASGAATITTGTISASTRLAYTTLNITGFAAHPLEQFNGYVALATVTGAQSIATAGTIQPSGASVVAVTTAGAVTGVILAAGIYIGQILTVYNTSANTLTFDVSGTSHVAGGTAEVIAANAARQFVWNGSLWYGVH